MSVKNYRVLLLLHGNEATEEFNTIDKAIEYILGSDLQDYEFELQEYIGWQTCKFGHDELRVQDVIGR